VLTLGTFLNRQAPVPTDEKTFFSQNNRHNALLVFENEEKLMSHAFTHGSETGRRSYFTDTNAYEAVLEKINNNPEERVKMIGTLALSDWLVNKASEAERQKVLVGNMKSDEKVSIPIGEVLHAESIGGMRAVIPLSLLLVLVLTLLLRERIRNKDEVALGI